MLRTVTKNLYLYILGGLVFGSGFILPLAWWWGILGTFLYLLAWWRTHSFKTKLLGSYLTIAIVISFPTAIFWSVYPIEWVDLNLGWYELLIVIGKWLVTSMVFGFGGVILASGLEVVKRSAGLFWALVCFPFLWVLSEILRSLLYSSFVLGNGNSLNIKNSVGYLGYLLGEHPWLLLFAKWGGVYSLSLVGAVLGVGMFFVYQQTKNTKVILATALVGALLIFSTNSKAPVRSNIVGHQGLTIAVINTNFGGRDFHQLPDNINERLRLTTEAVEAALATKSDYIVLPEEARFTPLNITNPLNIYQLFRARYNQPQTTLIDSTSIKASGGGAHLRAFVYDGVTQSAWVTDKQYLTPLGEYVPVIFKKLLEAMGLEAAILKLDSLLALKPGPIKTQKDFPSHVPGILFCFEALDPLSVKKLSRERTVPFVVHPISHAWFHDSELLDRQLDQILRIHAVWNQVMIVSAGNMVWGKVYLPNGQIVIPEKNLEGERWSLSLISW